MFIYYVYAYMSNGLPYYIGKGKGRRAFQKHTDTVPVPKDKTEIIFLETNLSNVGACAIERRMISWYGRLDIGTGILLNKTIGGEVGGLGYKHSEETRVKLSAAKKNMSDETRKKMSDAKKGQIPHNKGRSMSKANANKGKLGWFTHSEESRKKMSDAKKNMSDETRKKMSEASKKRPPRSKYSEESRQKLREAWVRRKAP